jgi:hypothetical protein
LIFKENKINEDFDVDSITEMTHFNDCIPVDNDCIFDLYLDKVEQEYFIQVGEYPETFEELIDKIFNS